MHTIKNKILTNLCYTELVYERINKKLSASYSKQQAEALIYLAIKETDEIFIDKIGKNYYVTNTENNMRITINSNNFRVITVDRIRRENT